MSSWFSQLGEKTGRSDIWVALITIYFLMCIVPFVDCAQGAMEKFIVTLMFIDLGVIKASDVFLGRISKRKE